MIARVHARLIPAEAVVLTLAVLVRVLPAVRGGGLTGDYGYDAGVYYSSADALINGRLPYRDFTFLHPPVVSLVVVPFAWLGKLTTDESGFIAANLFFCLIGAVNAVLVLRLCTRFGLERKAAIAGGLFYALWFGAVGSEFLIRLEPLGNLAALLGLLALTSTRAERTAMFLGGVGLGVAVSVKIWWAVPLLVVAGWQLLAVRSPRRAGFVLVGAASAAVLIDGPFAALAPTQMWSMVVTDQLGRNRHDGSLVTRLGELTGLRQVDPHLAHEVLGAAIVAVGLVLAWLCRSAWQRPQLRPVVVVGAAQVALLLVEPSWFPFYADFAAITASILVAAAPTPRLRVAVPAMTAGLTAFILATMPLALVTAFPGRARLTAAVSGVRCVQSDSPMGLIEVNALDRSFRGGCRNWVDVTGRTYGPDRSAAGAPRGQNPRWQRDLTAYLRSGGAVLLVRPGATGADRSTLRTVESGRVLASAGGHAIYRVQQPG